MNSSYWQKTVFSLRPYRAKTLPRKDLTAQRPYRAKTLPRKVERLILPGGGRADLAVRCNSSGDRTLASKAWKNDDTTFLGTGTLLFLKIKESIKLLYPLDFKMLPGDK
ncbi:hypothetical protein GZ78_19385 [Endozoicomonas numazuensis]|uniref:Uncharacterized protein n=1 Tax=Endozoicomonas numazuensis TaxID=1137799 RepID=A0A081NEF9_9GAMM|nr:hypothetical protein GZ78_19385 [Endozoicomonas numazuensis]